MFRRYALGVEALFGGDIIGRRRRLHCNFGERGCHYVERPNGVCLLQVLWLCSELLRSLAKFKLE